NGPIDHAEPPLQTCELVERELDLRRADERTVAAQRHGDAPDAGSHPLAVERHRAPPDQLRRGVRLQRPRGRLRRVAGRGDRLGRLPRGAHDVRFLAPPPERRRNLTPPARHCSRAPAPDRQGAGLPGPPLVTTYSFFDSTILPPFFSHSALDVSIHALPLH